MEYEQWPEEVIELNRELASGLHFPLEEILNGLGEHVTFAERIGHIAAYCDLILDGNYDHDQIIKIVVLLLERLKEKRINPNKTIYIN